MPFYKQVEVKDAKSKYGFSQQGIFAKELIKKGEALFSCDKEKCDYLQMDEYDKATTKSETEDLMNKYPESREFITKYIYMIDDDLYDYPKNYVAQTINENCMFFNHSCQPNTGFGSIDSALLIALRDIEINEELTYDYQCMDTEASYYDGLICKCGSLLCRKILKFNEYRNEEWQRRMLKYSGNHVKEKIEQLKSKWYASVCCLRRKYMSTDKKEFTLCLTALKTLPKDTLVAVFLEKISPDVHFLRQSKQPNCYLDANEVYTSSKIEAETELTLDYDDHTNIQ